MVPGLRGSVEQRPRLVGLRTHDFLERSGLKRRALHERARLVDIGGVVIAMMHSQCLAVVQGLMVV